MATTLMNAPAAGAGDYHQILCADPETGNPVGGGLPDGMSFWTNSPQFSGATQPSNVCTGPNHRGLSIAAQSTGPWSDGDRASLHYTTPPGLTLEEGTIYRFRRADTRFGNYLGSYQHGGPPDVDGRVDPNNHPEACNWANPSCFDDSRHSGNPASLGGWNQTQNRVEVVHSQGRWTYNFVCEPSGQAACTPGWAPAHYLFIYGGRMRLREDTAPAIVGTPAGGLHDDDVLSGVETLAYSADDGGGAGLYRLRIVLDGQTIQEQLVDPNAGRCQDVAPANANAFEFAHQRPCRASVTDATASLDTTQLEEGPHRLAVELEDAARNETSVVSNRPVTVDNVPPPEVVPGEEPTATVEGAPAPGARVRGTRGSWTGDGIAYSHRWERCHPQTLDCQSIAGADQLDYTLAQADVGSRVRFSVTASNREGSTTAASAPTAVIQAPPREIDPEPRSEDPTPADPVGPVAPREPEPPNGTTKARLRAALALSGPIAFGRSADLGGELTGDDGRVIGGATIEILSAPLIGGARFTTADTVSTDELGRFTWPVPPGPSRRLRIGYRARGSDAAYSATAEVDLLVRGAVRLSARPGRLRNGQAVRFTGRLLGEPPNRPVPILLEARVGRRWIPFARTRSRANGSFAARYRFRATRSTRRYGFRAVVARSTAWPYEPARSNVVRVLVRGS